MKKLSIAFLTLVLVSACGGGSSKSDSGSSGGASGGNTAPSIQLTDNTFTVAEGETAIGTISATDAEGDSISFTLIGDDAGVVSIGSTSGALSFNAVTDYEAPADADGDNTYEVTVRAYDGSAADARDILISVTNVVEAPVITSPASYEVLENETLVGNVTVSDSEGTVTYGISGADANLFAISSAGVLAFKVAPDFETPGSAAGSNTYSLTVEATNSGGTASKAVTVVVKDVEENALPTDLFISEYAEGYVSAGQIHNKYMEIYNGTGAEVSLADYYLANVSNAPSTPGEFEYGNETIWGDATSIADGEVHVVCHPDADPAILAHCDSTHQYVSNGDDGYKLIKGGTFVDADEDGKVDGGELTGYTVIDTLGDWQGDPGSAWDVCGVEKATEDNVLVKKERVEGNPDWDASRGTSATDCDWISKGDSDWSDLGKHCWNSNGDDAVTINNTSGAVSVEENTTAVATVSASVSGFCGDVTYALSGADAALFAVADGVVTFAAAPDFEAAGDANTDNVYNFTVTVTAGDASDTLDMVVTVTDAVGNLLLNGQFGDAVVDEATSEYVYNTGGNGYGGFANNNAELYPMTVAKKSVIKFNASVPSDASVDVYFKYEANPYPNTEPSYTTDIVTVTGSTAADYQIVVPSQGDKEFNNFILYLDTKDVPVVIKDVVIEEASPYADFSGTFGGTVVNADGSFTFPSTGDSWGGFANENKTLYPFSLATGALITFKGATVAEGDVEVKFRFEKNPHPDVDPAYDTTIATVSGTTEKEYSICVPAQDAANTYSSFLMYVVTQDAAVFVKDVEVTPYAEAVEECPTGVLEPTWGAFEGATLDGDVFTFTGADWAGWANSNEDIYPVDGASLEKITFMGSMVEADTEVNVRFRFEYKPYPDVDPAYDVTQLTKVTGTTPTLYEVPLVAQGDNDFSSFLLFLDTKDIAVKISDVKLYASTAAPEPVDPNACGNRGEALTGGGGKADICEAFGAGAVYDDEEKSFIFTPGDSWGGFANKDTSLFPLVLSEGATITLNASVPDGGNVAVRWQFENQPHPNNTVIYQPDGNVTVSGATETAYTFNVPAAVGDKNVEYNNFLMYLDTTGKKVIIKDVVVTPNAQVPAAN